VKGLSDLKIINKNWQAALRLFEWVGLVSLSMIVQVSLRAEESAAETVVASQNGFWGLRQSLPIDDVVCILAPNSIFDVARGPLFAGTPHDLGLQDIDHAVILRNGSTILLAQQSARYSVPLPNASLRSFTQSLTFVYGGLLDQAGRDFEFRTAWGIDPIRRDSAWMEGDGGIRNRLPSLEDDFNYVLEEMTVDAKYGVSLGETPPQSYGILKYFYSNNNPDDQQYHHHMRALPMDALSLRMRFSY